MSSTKPVGGAIPNSFTIQKEDFTRTYNVTVFKRSNTDVLVEHAMQAIKDFEKKGYSIEVDWIYPVGTEVARLNG